MVSTKPLAPALAQGSYQEVQNFYAIQMQMLDGGRVAEWADTFMEEGTFDANGRVSSGRAAIRDAARAAFDRITEQGLVRRHWIGMVAVTEQQDAALHVRSYAQIIETRIGGETRVLMSTVCEDVLVREGVDLVVRERRVRRDDDA